MKFHVAAPTESNQFTAYGQGFVAVNGRRIETSAVVLPDRVIEPWARSFDALAERDFVFLAELGAEVVLLGSGERLRFPDLRMAAALRAAGVGFEVMDTPAACRTYNILMEEGRRVAAALLLA